MAAVLLSAAIGQGVPLSLQLLPPSPGAQVHAALYAGGLGASRQPINLIVKMTPTHTRWLRYFQGLSCSLQVARDVHHDEAGEDLFGQCVKV